MHFETYVPARDREQLNERIESIVPVVLRYVYRGRNAWNSTWVTHYYDGCLHDTLKSAKHYAENKRGPGNVFYIEEIPALAFNSFGFAGLVAQINARPPLAQYRTRSVEEKSTLVHLKGEVKQVIAGDIPCILSQHGGLLACQKNVALAIKGVSITKAFASFEPDSPFWAEPQARTNSVLRVWHRQGVYSSDVLADAPLLKYRSVAQGTNYYLGWNTLGGTPASSHSHIIQLAETLSQTEN